jgi:hypothetical protein
MNPYHSYLARTTLLILLFYLPFSSAVAQKEKQKEPHWGNELSTPENAEEIRSILKSLSDDHDSAMKHFDTGLIVGPCLWARLEKADKDISAYAKMIEKKRDGDDKSFFLKVLFTPKLKFFIKSPSLKILGATFLTGAYRAGTASERHVIYQMGYIRAKTPLTVVQVENAVLAINIQDSKVQVMEMVSDWQTQ